MASDAREIALLIEPWTSFGRGVLDGIAEYSRQRRSWRFLINSLEPTGCNELPQNWNGSGVIGRTDVGHRKMMAKLDCPIVNISANSTLVSSIPSVIVDYGRVGRVAAEHLMDCGLRHFGYFGDGKSPVEQGFRRRLNEARLTCQVFTVRQPNALTPPSHDYDRVIKWLHAMPKPAGIMTRTDLLGRFLIQACVWSDIQVPEQIAVVGCTNETILCRMSRPELSSVQLATQRQGYEAAALLDRLMHGEAGPKAPIMIEPTGVMVRQSTETLAIEDREVADAVHFIRAHAHLPIRVEDVLEVVPLSRRSLEYRFIEWLGRTPAAEIRRVRLERIAKLLRETELSMNQIAAKCGYATAEHMSTIFRKHFVVSPGQYRATMRRQLLVDEVAEGGRHRPSSRVIEK